MGWLVLLVALVVVGAWLLVQRLRIVEQRLREGLQDRPTQEELGALDVPGLREQLREQEHRLQRMREAFEDVQRDREHGAAEQDAAREQSAQLSREVDALRRQVAELQSEVQGLREELTKRPAGTANEVEAEGLEPRITRALAEEGFEDARILGPAADTGEHGPIVVEARRAGAAYKGTARVDDGQLSLHLTPCYKVFP